jgi:hypothetical protein
LIYLIGSAAALCTSFTVLLFLLVDLDDYLRVYTYPEFHRGVRDVLRPASPDRLHRTEAGDFDGDGITDKLDTDYVHREPLFQRTTSGMVYVRSGRTGELLLAHAVATPFNYGEWVGDVDGNGTSDVLIRDNPRPVVLGFKRQR